MDDSGRKACTQDSELGILPSFRVWVGGHNIRARKVVESQIGGTRRPPKGTIDLGFVTPESVEEAVYFVRKLLPRLTPESAVWIVYPNPGSPRRAEFSGDAGVLADAVAGLGFIQTATLGVGDHYTFSRFERVAPRDAQTQCAAT